VNFEVSFPLFIKIKNYSLHTKIGPKTGLAVSITIAHYSLHVAHLVAYLWFAHQRVVFVTMGWFDDRLLSANATIQHAHYQ